MGFFSFCKRRFALVLASMISWRKGSSRERRPLVSSPSPLTGGENPIHPPTNKGLNYPRVVLKHFPGVTCEKCLMFLSQCRCGG